MIMRLISLVLWNYARIMSVPSDTGEQNIAMAEKKSKDLQTFIENVNKKDEKRNGKRIDFHFTKRKRKR